MDQFVQAMTPDTRELANKLVLFNSGESDWHRRSALAKAITLIESHDDEKVNQAAAFMTFLLHNSSKEDSFRIGFAGSPGAGKSSFIEAFGKYILNLSSEQSDRTDFWKVDKLAVVCIDPSSLRSGGSILGDKTRMTALSSDPRAFVRPAAARGILGGLAPRTDDVLRLLSQQYPLTILETVGVGQSEVEVQHSVDMLILTVPPGGGDELQGVKKGIVEVADMIVVTKADGSLLTTAKHTAGNYRSAMTFLSSVTAHLNDNVNCSEHALATKVVLTSAVTGIGFNVVWESICEFRRLQLESGRFKSRRRQQGRYWMWKNVQVAVQESTSRDPALQESADTLHNALDEGAIPPRVAATILLQKLKDLHCNRKNQ